MMVVSAIRVVTTKNVVHAALYLTGVLAGVGVDYLLLQAEFVAITQFLVYKGIIFPGPNHGQLRRLASIGKLMAEPFFDGRFQQTPFSQNRVLKS